MTAADVANALVPMTVVVGYADNFMLSAEHR